MKIYCISLPERVSYCNDFFKTLNPPLEVHFIETCLADNIEDYPKQTFISPQKTTKYDFVAPNYRQKKTKLACSISHRNALNTFLQTDESL